MSKRRGRPETGEEMVQWAEQQFAAAQLSDVRRRRRVVAIAQAMATTPGASVPKLFDAPYDVKATYNLFGHPEATPERLQAGHRAQVLERMREPGTTTLLLEDTSICSWSGHAPNGPDES